MKHLLLIVLFIILSGCSAFDKPLLYDNAPRTIPGNFDQYYMYEIEGVTYYSVGGNIVCPERDKALIKLGNNLESIHLPYY